MSTLPQTLTLLNAWHRTLFKKYKKQILFLVKEQILTHDMAGFTVTVHTDFTMGRCIRENSIAEVSVRS